MKAADELTVDGLDQIITLIEVAKICRCSPRSVWRWSSQTCGASTLQTWLVGRRRVTTRQALADFITTNSVGQRAEVTTRRTASLQEDHAAETSLRRAGILDHRHAAADPTTEQVSRASAVVRDNHAINTTPKGEAPR